MGLSRLIGAEETEDCFVFEDHRDGLFLADPGNRHQNVHEGQRVLILTHFVEQALLTVSLSLPLPVQSFPLQVRLPRLLVFARDRLSQQLPDILVIRFLAVFALQHVIVELQTYSHLQFNYTIIITKLLLFITL